MVAPPVASITQAPALLMFLLSVPAAPVQAAHNPVAAAGVAAGESVAQAVHPVAAQVLQNGSYL